MMNLMHSRRSYVMSLEEVQYFVTVCKSSGYQFKITLSGGEPLIWPYLKEGLRILRGMPVTIFSNVVNISKVDDEVMSLVSYFRVSLYDSNQENAKVLKERYPEKVRIVNRQAFWVNPQKPMPNALPAECMNSEFMLMDYFVYACPHSASIAISCGESLETLRTPLKDGFFNELVAIRKNQESTICSRCISNAKVRHSVENVRNVKNAKNFL